MPEQIEQFLSRNLDDPAYPIKIVKKSIIACVNLIVFMLCDNGFKGGQSGAPRKAGGLTVFSTPKGCQV